MNKKLKGVVYARVSTIIQGQESIENQYERLDKFLEFKENIVVVDKIYDIASGGDDNRAGLKRLISMIKNKEIDVVIVTELSRISRKMATLISIIEETKKQEITVISILENIDTSTPMGKAMLLMNGVFAELERDNIKRRVKNTLDTKAQNGNHTGGVAPYGYDLINKKLIPNPEKALIVKKVFQEFIKCKNLNEISKRFKIKKTTVRRILKSETYIGNKVYGTRKVNSDGKIVKANPENIKIIPNAHEAIVDKEIFYLVQKILNKNVEEHHAKRKKQQKKYLLYGLLKCYNGHTLYGEETTGKYRFYSCTMHKTTQEFGKTGYCPKKHVSANKIENQILNDLINFDISKVDIKKGIKIKEEELKQISFNMKKYLEKRNVLTDLYLDKEIEKEEYLKRKKEIDKNIKKYEIEIKTLENDIQQSSNQEKSIKLLKKIIEKLKVETSFEKKQEYLHLVINKIQFINDFEYEIYFNI
nr:recombinase family protein [uncultured Fusobacterium sp.]